MDLENPSRENIAFILSELQNRLTMANASVLDPHAFDTDVYNDLLELYQLVNRKENVSISEMEAIVSELGSLRKK